MLNHSKLSISDLETAPRSDSQHGRVRLSLPGRLSQDLRRLALEQGVSLFDLLLGSWAVLLGRWSEQEEVTIGTTMSRPLRIHVLPDSSIAELLSQVKAKCDAAGRPANVSLEEGVGGAMDVSFEYKGDPFDRATAERMTACLQVLLEGIVLDSRRSISRLPLMTSAEREQVLYGVNDTHEAFPEDRLIHELFEEQASRTPNAIAVVHGQQAATFDELNSRANQLARYLRGKGVGPDCRVALCIERSIDMVVALLGVLKAGGAYVPLDPAYPQERLAYMLKDSVPHVLVTQEHLARTWAPAVERVVAMDSDSAAIARQDRTNLAVREVGVTADNLAYVIYTSGSTGKPKGAMNEHRGMVNRILAQRHFEVFSATDVCCQKTSVCFVDAVFEIFGPLCHGRRLIIIPSGAVSDLAEMAALITRHNVTQLITVPSLARSMLQDAAIVHNLSGLRVWTLSGEEVSADLMTTLQKRLPACEVIIQYGSSEVSSDAAIYKCRGFEGDRVPIGRPIPNARIYILDRHGEPVPVGVSGEIFVGGVGVGRGYLNRPELTAMRFVPDPFSNQRGARLYRTGDVGRWRADGLLEYIGRNDHLVKIRGFRVEPGEIEAQLRRHAQVREAAVIAREQGPGEKRLVAYVVLHGESREEVAGQRKTIDSLRAHLMASLPEYMVPAAFVEMEALPRTPNGKLDRRALPAPGLDAYSTKNYEPPQGDFEVALARIWRELLKFERVGRQDNFFELGGHSLLMVLMKEDLRREGLSLSVRSAYENPTLAAMAGTLLRSEPGAVEPAGSSIPVDCAVIVPQMLPLVDLNPEHIARIVESVPGGAANIQDVYPLAPLQDGILFHSLLDEQAGDTYVRPMLLSLASRGWLEALVTALQAVIDRHDALRTAFFWEHLPKPVQVVHRRAELQVEQIELDRDLDPIEQMKQRMKPGSWRLELRSAPLLQLQIAEDPHTHRWYALLVTHHIVCDNESLEILVAEVMAFLNGSGGALPAAAPYRNHVAQVLVYARTHDAESFFRGRLADVYEPTAPFGLLDVHVDGSQLDQARSVLHPALARRLRTLARSCAVSTATLFHAAWALVVAHTSGRDDVVFGSVLLGRMQGSAGSQRTLGLFINTLPLRVELCGLSAHELVRRTQRGLAELLEHEQASLAVAQRCSGIAGGVPLFTSLLNYLHSSIDIETAFDGTAGVRCLATQGGTNYAVTLSVEDHPDKFVLDMKTDRRIGAARMMEYMRAALRSLVEALADATHTPASSLAIMPKAERQQVVGELNATQAAYPQEKLIHELFEEQVRRSPAAVAVSCESQSLTYAELNARANQLARYLRANGVGPDRLVALFMERSLDLLVGLFAVLKAGGAYVPLDPTNPAARLEHTLADARPEVVLTQRSLKAMLPPTPATVIALDGAWDEISQQAEDDLNRSSLYLHPQQLAYVIYTSGSTGKPKGVMVEHRNVVNYATYAIRQFDVAAGGGSLICTSISFDLMLTGLYPTLLCGRPVRLCPEQQGLPNLAAELVRSRNLAPLKLTPSHLALLEEPLRKGELTDCVRVLILGGESLPASSVQLWKTHAPRTRIFNHYGPTEATVGCVVNEIRDAAATGPIPIGRPVANTQIYILDRHLQPVPTGVVGEIYVGGAGVARGYLNQPALTAQRFLPDPFSADPRARMYETGDLGRLTPEGTVEYLGRNDDQVKIRGYRIEPGEIEARLLAHEKVSGAAVMAREDVPGERRLVAYVTGRGQSAPAVEELRAHVRVALPDYMVPSAVVLLERFPLTPNGKIDRRALPVPELQAYASRQYEPPRGRAEQMLASIWEKLLRLPRIGRNDNFFELGGHSLSIVQMREQLRQIGLSVSVRSVYESHTLAALAATLSLEDAESFEVPPNLIPAGCEKVTPEMLTLVDLRPEHIEGMSRTVPGGMANIQDIYPLAPLQEGMLFHHVLDETAGDTYIESLLLSVPSRERLDLLISALQRVVDRHDILRTAVLWEHLPRPVQVVYREALVPVEEFELHPDQDVMSQFGERMKPERQRLDLRRAPLLRLQVAADPGGGTWYALLQLHHSVSDHESTEKLLTEIVECLAGRARHLREPAAYRDHVAQALAYAGAHDSRAFFSKALEDIDEPTAPFGLLDVHGDGSRIDHVECRLDPGLAERVRVQARGHAVSAATLFHAAWALVISCTSGRDDVVFGTVLLGRLQGNAGSRQMLGMFINTLPLRLRLRGVTTKELVEQAQQAVMELLTHEQASLAVAQSSSGLAGSVPLFSALLNYRHSAVDIGASLADAGVQLHEWQGLTNYPVNLSVDDMGDRFQLVMETDRRIDPRSMMAYTSTALESLIEALEKAPQTPALGLAVVPARERSQIIESFNATQAQFPKGALMHQLFEQQVERTPAAIAMDHAGQTLTYAELNSKANQLAGFLREQGIGPERLVAICVERGIEMVVGLLGILKAGGAYVSLDPSYPVERLDLMLKDAAPAVLLTQEKLRSKVRDTEAHVITLDGDWSDIARQPSLNIDAGRAGLRPDNLAYLIYTSGSTGRPKGVAIEHRNAVNLIFWAQSVMPRGAFARTLHSTSLNFDLSVYECFVPLATGGSLQIVENALALVSAPAPVTLINTVPSAISGVLDSASIPETTRVVNLAGEALKRELVERIFERSSVERVCNLYGPSETTTYSTAVSMPRERGFVASIGYPIANTQIYILGRGQQVVPIGVVGEIYIGGAGVARGYLNRPALTAERFVANPFSADPRARMYRTGDLGRWLPDGTIEYLGRNDHQLKIRGYRIELGEIESQLMRHEQVKDAVVVAREDAPGDKRLVAYVVADRSRSSQPRATENLENVRSEIVSEWETLWEETYGTKPAAGPSFVGWKSSFTGQPIPEAQMQEWLGGVVERIRALQPKRLLEIGCGVGLLLQHLAPDCTAYVGTDFSAPALDHLRRWVSRREELRHVELLQREATALTDLPSGSFDTVVLNSVVQYFPDVNYLMAVLQAAVRLLAPGGKIFVGDVRNLRLLSMFHGAVQLSKAAASVTVRQLRQRIARAVAQDRELVIDPDFFELLPMLIPAIGEVEIQLKRGRASNELTRYRYDVVLRKGEPADFEPFCQPVPWGEGVSSVADLTEALAQQRWIAVRVHTIPNARLARDAEAQELIEASDERTDAGEIRRKLEELACDGVEPEDLWALAARDRCEVRVTWPRHGSPQYLEAEVFDRNRVRDVIRPERVTDSMRAWSTYANDPMDNSFRQRLIPQLREYIKARLPEYMVPSAWVVLNQLPLTPNGKVDRRALPVPQSRPEEIGEYIAPRTRLERTLAEIWARVLRIDQVGVHDNFFELGGHSLLIVQMKEQLRQAGLSVAVRSVYQSPTLAALARTLSTEVDIEREVPPNLIPPDCEAISPDMLTLVALGDEEIERVVRTVPGGAANIQDIYPLAPLQEGLLFHHLLDEHLGDTYVVPLLLELASKRKLEEFIQALQEVMSRHDVLRTAVVWEHLPRPVQVVYRRAALPVEELVLHPDRDVVEQLRERMKPEYQRLSIDRAPLLRLQIAEDKSTAQWYALLQLHHIVSDHDSLETLLAEVMTYLEGRARELPPPVPYRNHVAQALAHAETHDAEEFFRSKLADVDEPTVAFGLTNVHGHGAGVDRIDSTLDSVLAKRIRSQARRLGVSAATLFHASWAAVVACTSRRDDVVFGTVLLGRLQVSAGQGGVLGMFMNSLPLRLRLKGVSVKELVEQTQREIVELLNYEQASLAVAQRCSGVSGGTPLFSTLMNYRHSAPNLDSQLASAGARLVTVRSWTNYPVLISVDDLGEDFGLTAQTDQRIDPGRMLGYVTTALRSLLSALEQAPQTPAESLTILPESEARQVLESFNATPVSYPEQKRVHELVEEQVRLTPDAEAVLHENRMLTYAELNRKANQLARYLRNRGVGAGHLVGISLNRSLEMVVGLLGILKAGAAYLPLDPSYPSERLRHMLEDADPPIVLTQADVMAALPVSEGRMVMLDAKWGEISSLPDHDLGIPVSAHTAESPVYVIYTSGSTGRPKGTAMAHRSMVNLIEWHRGVFPESEGKRVLQFAALSFDVAFQDTFTTLCLGGTLVLLDETVRKDPVSLMKLLARRSVERMFVPPLMLQSLAECFQSTGIVAPTLRDVITAGEQLRISPEITNLFEHLRGCRLHNHYGPTESHVVTALTLSGDPEQWPALPSIGRPIANTQIYILDAQRRPVPIGVAGEIYIGGANVALGYLKRPELTARRFIADPFRTDSRSRLYMTGDLGRWREDGTLEYLGRNDDQVKIRGFRIELGEIEAQLARHRKVKEAAVAVREDIAGNKRLVAYVTEREWGAANVEELRAHLKGVLPEHMVPSAIVILDSLPLTPSGKLNRRALPVPSLAAYVSEQYEAPVGEIEEVVADTWRELLGVDRVGRQDNFFELGGHSLHGMKLAAKMAERLGVRLPVVAVFQYPTVQGMALRIETLQAEASESSSVKLPELDEGVV